MFNFCLNALKVVSQIKLKRLFQFKLQIIAVVGSSEMYATGQSIENGIDAVKRDAPNTLIVDTN